MFLPSGKHRSHPSLIGVPQLRAVFTRAEWDEPDLSNALSICTIALHSPESEGALPCGLTWKSAGKALDVVLSGRTLCIESLQRDEVFRDSMQWELLQGCRGSNVLSCACTSSLHVRNAS